MTVPQRGEREPVTERGDEPSMTLRETVLMSYLSGQQDGQEWALLDNLSADDVREVAQAAIVLLKLANPCIALASVALDGMTPRPQRFAAKEAAEAYIGPYMAALTKGFGLVGVPSEAADG